MAVSQPPDPPEIPKQGCEAIRAEIAKYDGWHVATMAAVAEAESRCKLNATGDTTLTFTRNGRVYGYSVGAMQVRILPNREACDTHNLEVNIKCAYKIWQSQGYAAWTMYNNGKYKEFLK